MRLRALGAALCLVAGPLLAGTTPLPFDIGGPYELTDQHGQTRTEADPDGHAQLLFFGYANCPDICTAALPQMAGVVDAMAAEGVTVTPVMITVAPEQDRVDTMGAPLAKYHADFIGLTGDEKALEDAWEAFAVEVEPLFMDPEYGWIYSHGSFVHLLDGDGKLLTLLPPILNVDDTAKIVRTYLSPDTGS